MKKLTPNHTTVHSSGTSSGGLFAPQTAAPPRGQGSWQPSPGPLLTRAGKCSSGRARSEREMAMAGSGSVHGPMNSPQTSVTVALVLTMEGKLMAMFGKYDVICSGV